MRNGIVFFHQGWTDIVNCLPLVRYYYHIYDSITLIMRDDAKEMVNYYLNDILDKVKILYVEKKELDSTHTVSLMLKKFGVGCDILFHGQHDIFRNDIYTNSFMKSDVSKHFVSNFYESYSIPSNSRFTFNSFRRDHDLEDIVYKQFLGAIPTSNYVLSHFPKYWDGNFTIPKFDYNLDGATSNPFSFIKVLSNSKEIHLVDSVWASVIYNLDMSNFMFRNTMIYLYPHNYAGGILSDKNANIINVPSNWTIIK